MQTFDVEITGYTRGEVRRLYGVGDFHIGTKAFARHECIKRLAEIAADKQTPVILMGDYIEAIIPGDLRFEADAIDTKYEDDARAAWSAGRRYLHPFTHLVDLQIREALELLRPIATQVIGVHGGNHERKIVSKFGGITDPLSRIVEGLNDYLRTEKKGHQFIAGDNPVKDYGYGRTMTRLYYPHSESGRDCVVVDSAHGVVAGRKSGAKVNRMTDIIAQNQTASIFLRAHGHTDDIKKVTQLTVPTKGNCKYVQAVQKIGMYTGTMKKTYGEHGAEYADRGDYDPLPLELPCIHFKVNPFLPIGVTWMPIGNFG